MFEAVSVMQLHRNNEKLQKTSIHVRGMASAS